MVSDDPVYGKDSCATDTAANLCGAYGHLNLRMVVGSVGMGAATRGHSVCAAPGCENKAQYRCGRCKTMWYCGKPCQKAQWTAHHRKQCVEEAVALSLRALREKQMAEIRRKLAADPSLDDIVFPRVYESLEGPDDQGITWEYGKGTRDRLDQFVGAKGLGTYAHMWLQDAEGKRIWDSTRDLVSKARLAGVHRFVAHDDERFEGVLVTDLAARGIHYVAAPQALQAALIRSFNIRVRQVSV